MTIPVYWSICQPTPTTSSLPASGIGMSESRDLDVMDLGSNTTFKTYTG